MSETMRAARFEGGGRITLVERPIPTPGVGEVLVKVDSCALCGTDRGAYLTGSSVIPGHETSGTVMETGAGADPTLVGARGIVYLVGYCGHCYCCRSGWTNMCLDKQQMYGFTADGGYAEFVTVRADCFLPVSDDVGLDTATALLDLYGTPAHAFKRAGRNPPGNVAVMGCGPIGIGAISMAKCLGAERVLAFDISQYRLELAGRLGATPVNAAIPDAVEAARGPDGFEVVIEAAGVSETQRRAIQLAAPYGKVVFVAHNHNAIEVWTLQDLIVVERTLLGSEYFPKSEFDDNHALLLSGALDPSTAITHRFGLEEISRAFETFMAAASGKVLVRP